MRDIKEVIDVIRKDSRYQRLLSLFNNSELFVIPTDNLTKEIVNMHKGRDVRFLSHNDVHLIDKVVEANIRDQSYRSRLVEIQIQCFKAEDALEQSLEPLKEYILTRYHTNISFVRTKEERMRVVNTALSKFNKFIAEVHRVRMAAEMVIKDIDQAAYSLQRTINALSVTHRPERNI